MDEIKVLKEKLKKKNERVRELIAQNKKLNRQIDEYSWNGQWWKKHDEVASELYMFQRYIEKKYFKVTFTALTSAGRQSTEQVKYLSGYFIEHEIQKLKKKFEDTIIINVERTA